MTFRPTHAHEWHAVLALLLLVGSAAAQNVLQDASFEGAAAASAGLSEHWSLETAATNGDGKTPSSAARDVSAASDGSASLRLSGDRSTGRWLGAMQVAGDVRPGRRYRLAAVLRTKNVRQETNQYVNCNVFAQFKDANGAVVRDESGYPAVGTQPLLGTHDWTPVETTVRVPEGAATVSVGCFLSCSGTAWFDAVVFEPLVSPSWNELDKGRYVYRWEGKGGPPEEAVAGNLAHLESLEEQLGVTLDKPVQYHRYRSNERKGEVTGMPGNAHVEREDEIHSIFWSDRHEIVHLLTKRWGGGTALLGEGIAVHFSGGWHGRDLDSWVRDFARDGTLLPLRDIVATSDFRRHADGVTYPEAGSFVKYLLETHGVESFRALYVGTTLDPAPDVFDRDLEASCGQVLEALEADWLRAAGVKTRG